MTRLLDSPPTPGQMIRDLFCWIGTYADGTEGILGGGVPGIGMMPLFTSRRSSAERMEPVARQVMALSQDGPHKLVGVRLVTFTSTEGTRQ